MSFSSGSTVSWNFSDDGIGTSMDHTTTTAFSTSTTIEKKLNMLRSAVFEEAQKFEKALKDIEKMEASNNKFSEDRIKAEKILLSTILKRELLLGNCRLLMYTSNGQVECNIGSVTLSNIKLEYGGHCRSGRSDEFYLCTLSLQEDCSLFLSEICQPNHDGSISFNVNHTFTNLSVQFVILVKIYSLKIGRKSLAKRLWQRLSNHFARCEPSNPNNRSRDSLFQFCYQTKITVGDANTTKEIVLGVANSKLSKMSIDVAGVVDTSGFSQQAWMDVSRNGLFWNQRWCVLNGTQLNCFNYPTDTKPVISTDLKKCIMAKLARPVQESRNRVIKFQFPPENLRNCSLYLCSTSRSEFEKWKMLENLVPTLKCWMEADCLIV